MIKRRFVGTRKRNEDRRSFVRRRKFESYSSDEFECTQAFKKELEHLKKVAKSVQGVDMGTEVTLSCSFGAQIDDSFEDIDVKDIELELTLGELLGSKQRDVEDFFASVPQRVYDACDKLASAESDAALSNIVYALGLQDIPGADDKVFDVLSAGGSDDELQDSLLRLADDLDGDPDGWILNSDYWLDEIGHPWGTLSVTLDCRISGARGYAGFNVEEMFLSDGSPYEGSLQVEKLKDSEFEYACGGSDEIRKRRMESMRMHRLIGRSRNPR